MRTLLLAALLLSAAAANADSLTKQLRACATIKSDGERLACYDTLGNSLDQRAEQNFGHEQQRIAEEAPDSINAAITSVQAGAYGKLVLALDNGQVWRQSDSARVNWSQGDKVLVERGLFGSFFMKDADGGRKIRVRRVQ